MGNVNLQNVPAMQATMTGRIPVKLTTYTMTETDITVHADSTAGAFTITAPPASLAHVGRIYTVRLLVDNGNVTLAFPEGSHNPADQVITIALGYVNFVSDGAYWYVLASLLA